MAEFKLPCGKIVLIDDDDLPLLVGRRWYSTTKAKGGRVWYVVGRFPGGRGEVLLHRHIAGEKVDHINHDGLDNRRSNLRPATIQQNNFNQRKRIQKRGPTSRYKGVHLQKVNPNKPWRAAIMFGGKRIVSSHKTEEEAARAYDQLAREYHGAFAVLNFSSTPWRTEYESKYRGAESAGS